MTERGTPWWAEDDPAGHGVGSPSNATSGNGRSSNGTGAASSGGQASGGAASGDSSSGPSWAERPTWPEMVRLVDMAVRAATQATRRAGAAGSGTAGTGAPHAAPGDVQAGSATRGPGAWDDLDGGHAHSPDVCSMCPVCSLMRSLDGNNPDAIAHLLEAARHATLAVKSIIDAQASRFGASDDFEQIRVDE